MAWVLQFDGVNDYTSLASPVFNPIPIGGSLEYNGIRGFGTPSLQMFINVYQGARTDIIAFNNLGIIRVRIDGTIKNSVDSVAQGDQFTLLITRTASLYAISLNGVHQFDIVETADMSELLGFCQSNFQYEGDLLTSTLNNGTSDTALWDATASSHAAGTPVLTDTIGGNDATGVNMPTDGSAWVDLGGSGISIAVTEVLNAFVDTSNINIDYNVSATVTETLNSFGDTSVISVTSGQVVNLSVTETLSAFTDLSTVNVSANVDLIVTEVLNSFLDGSNVTIAKELTLQVTEVFNSFADNSSVRLPANWNDKPKVTTSYTTQTPVSTIWIDKG